jgi:hypothetical protein
MVLRWVWFVVFTVACSSADEAKKAVDIKYVDVHCSGPG